jgi:cob(I)alamin adenosyltransferase
MVQLDKIYTRAGDGGKTRLATGEPVDKWSLRVEAYGAVDETNSVLGVARLHTATDGTLDPILMRIQNDLFDLGADLATPERDAPLKFEALRIVPSQVERLEHEIDALNANLSPLTSFVLPGGTAAAAHLHVARAICRRAERLIAQLSAAEKVAPAALHYANRLSDLLFVAARWANAKGEGDVLWLPGKNRT